MVPTLTEIKNNDVLLLCVQFYSINHTLMSFQMMKTKSKDDRERENRIFYETRLLKKLRKKKLYYNKHL